MFYIVILILTAALCLSLAGWGLTRLEYAGAIPFVTLMCAIGIWSGGYAFEIGSTALETKLVFAKLQYVGIGVAPAAVLAYGLCIARFPRRMSWLSVVAISIEPAAMMALVVSNDWHSLVWPVVTSVPVGEYLFIEFGHGPAFWAHNLLSHAMLLAGIVMFARRILASPLKHYRLKSAVAVVGLAGPWLGNVLYVSHFNPLHPLDLTPLGFFVTGAVIAWSIRRVPFLHLIPIARKHAFAAMTDAVIVYDSADRIVDFNPAAERLLRLDALSQAAGRTLTLTGRPLAGSVDDKALIEFEGRRFEIHSSDLEVERGIAAGHLEVLVDVTERLAAERALRTLNEQLELALEKAISSERVKSEFLANMSHEIRTPMNAVVGVTGLLLDSRLSPTQRDRVELIRASGETLLAIINEILDFSKIEAGRLDLEESPFVLADCLRDALLLIGSKAESKGLALHSTVQSGTPACVIGDVTRVRQVLVNLLDNAVKFTPEGEIGVAVSSRPLSGEWHEIEFAVRDTGIGIPADRLERLFQPFSQVDTSTTREYGGTGLGLSISRRLVELMNGRIWVDSSAGIGSTFRCTIHVEQAPVETIQRSDSECLNRRPSGVQSPLHILLVEDNAVNQRVALMLIESLGHRADVAANGIEAIAALERRNYDMALMDVQMPVMDGIEATRRIRQRWPGTLGPRIIAMTANAMRGDRERCIEAGMDDYLSKPVHIDELEEILGRVDGPPLAEGGDPEITGASTLEPGRLAQLRSLERSGSPGIVAHLIEMYLSDGANRVEAIAESGSSGNAAAMRFAAHTLKGASTNIGAQRLASICDQIERAAAAGKFVPHTVITALRDEFARVTDEMLLEKQL